MYCLGEIFLDQDIKLFEFKDIQKYSGYNDGPESREFCRFYTSKAARELDGFDSSIFWSTGLLWKHFRTCGVERWDRELKGLVDHYRNWREWAHEVHNLPNNNNQQNKSGTATHKVIVRSDRQISRGLEESGVCKDDIFRSIVIISTVVRLAPASLIQEIETLQVPQSRRPPTTTTISG